MLLRPVQQRQLELGHPLAQIGVVAPLAHLGGHFRADRRDAGITGVLFIAHQQVQLGVLLHLYAQLVQALDGGVAGKEILRPGAEGDDFQIAHADNGPGDGDKLGDHSGDVLRRAHGVLGDIALEMPHPQVIGAVQHSAVGVAPSVDQVPVPLGGGHKHAGAVKIPGNQRLRRLGAEVAQEHHQGVAAMGFHVLHGFQHSLLVFHRDRALVQLAGTGGLDGGPALLAQGDGKAVPGDGDEAQLYLGNIGQLHRIFLLFKDRF